MIDDDRDLREAFRHLREADRDTTPAFRIDPKPPSRPFLAFAVVIAVIAIFGYRSGKFSDDDRHHGVDYSIAAWQGPTDFLLQTPGRELVASTPSLEPRVPSITIPGGL